MMEDNTDALNVFKFLRSRGISEEAVTVMEQQKIDREVILLMEDAELAKYLPSYGDRIALIHFCRHQTPSVKRKLGLFNKLKEKMKLRKEENEDEPQTLNKKANCKTKPCTRTIEIGWLHKESEVVKQVRARQGGGTRKIQISVQAGYDEILKEGKALFFPNGSSTKGPESDFEFEVWDFKQNPLPKNLSVGMIYNTVKLPMLRFYIATCPKMNLTEESSDEPDQATDASDLDLNKGDGGSTQNGYEQLDLNEPQDTLPDVFFISAEDISVNSSGDHLASLMFNVSSDPEITFGPQEHSDRDSLNDTLAHEPCEQSAPNALPDRILTIHYSNSFNDMIEAFSDNKIVTQSLSVQRILPNNSEEAGSGPGVLRDVYSSFWSDFYEHCTVGTSVKVPFLRHDFSTDKWKAVGRVLLKGFKDCKYMPIKLAAPFLEEMLFGVVYTDLKETFLNFVSCQERDVLKQALNDFSSVDMDDLLDIMNTYECRRKVTASSLSAIVDEIAHKELIQKPMFVIDCWKEVTNGQISLSHENIEQLYKDLEPTPKKVIGFLKFPPGMSNNQAEVANHLKRYIREIDEDKLRRFLRFCTGSDLMVADAIQVQFTFQTDFTRRPIGRTCGSVLELSDSYDNFPQFRAEFNCVLESNIWVMDIV
ncbi:uncharacterized protein [Misgurnus anguillicaudatus]|uniref:uncharacterized protein n=1 Tax=Misgurnus anguillicaudatus TaxID=75329 RepID=UPI002435DD61|nr:uncharacterized protein LOC129437524 [Misgurnus anguillicaudatus]XP_055076218.1 uncharacterized protein LOC129455485 [Misgurnus anguillicaudatus]